jgi:outer membrane protein TolC
MKINSWGAAGRSLTRPHPRESSGRLGEKVIHALIVILLAAWGAATLPAWGKEPPATAATQATEAVNGPVNYDRAVRLALRGSPYFTRSSLEIEVKRLDETDSKFDLIPPITFRTQYYLTRPADVSSKAYSLSFASSSYNPVEAYFTLQAKKMFTQLAVLAHMQVISEGIQKLGGMFLEMDTLQQAAARQDDLVDLARQNLDYFQNRSRIGAATSLEVRIATQELEGAQAEKERIASSQKRLLNRIKALIGLKSDQPLELDCKDVRRQVMGAFDPTKATLDQAQAHSYELKMAALKKELQKYNILLAKARLLPTFYLGMQSPDPLSTTSSRGLFFSLGLEIPVWDGFKRVRNVSRQKTILRQFGVETDEKTIDLAGKWQDAQENLRASDVARKAAQSQEELALLKERQGDIRYHSGGEPLTALLGGRRSLVEAKRNTSLKTLDYDLAVLMMRHLSGDLGTSYVDASSWQQ